MLSLIQALKPYELLERIEKFDQSALNCICGKNTTSGTGTRVVKSCSHSSILAGRQEKKGKKREKKQKQKLLPGGGLFFFPSLFQVPHHTRTKLAGWACLDSCKQPTTNHTSQRGREEGLEKVSTGIGIEKAQHPVGNGGRGEEKSSTVFGYD